MARAIALNGVRMCGSDSVDSRGLRCHGHRLPRDRGSWILVLVMILRRQNVGVRDRNLMPASCAPIDARIWRRSSRAPLEIEVAAIVGLQKSDVLIVRHFFSTSIPGVTERLRAPSYECPTFIERNSRADTDMPRVYPRIATSDGM